MSPRAVTTALTVILPSPEQTWLLRACLQDGEAGREAWRVWRELAGDAKAAMAEDRWGVKRLLPLLYSALRRNGAEVDAALLPYLRTVFAREQMRTATYLRICGDVLTAVEREAIPTILLRGAATAVTSYEDPALRHCHDISLLVGPDDMRRAAGALRGCGLTSAVPEPSAYATDVYLRHESTLTVELHTRLFEVPFYDLPMADVLPRTREASVGGTPARVLSPTDALLHACGHASYSPSRKTLRWVCDAWHLLRRHPDLDWDLLIETARRSRLTLPLAVTLRYLAEELGAPVPAVVLKQVERDATRAPAVERDVALRGARLGSGQEQPALLRRIPGGWRVRASVAVWLLFPSRQYVREVMGVRGGVRVWAQYALRPFGYLRDRLRARRGRHTWATPAPTSSKAIASGAGEALRSPARVVAK